MDGQIKNQKDVDKGLIMADDELVTPSDQVAISQASLGALLHKNTYITLLSSVCGKPSKITQNINSFNRKTFAWIAFFWENIEQC